jgi:hypothetical protein
MEIKFGDYKTIKEAAAEWNITTRMVHRYCATGRIHGAMQKGNLWLIPMDADKPADRRKGNGRQPSELKNK